MPLCRMSHPKDCPRVFLSELVSQGRVPAIMAAPIELYQPLRNAHVAEIGAP
jgi:hypothetical protein